MERAMEQYLHDHPTLTGSLVNDTPTSVSTTALSPSSVSSGSTQQSSESGSQKKKGGGARQTKADSKRGKKGLTPEALTEIPPARLPNIFFFRQVLRTALPGQGPQQVSPQVCFVMEAAVKVRVQEGRGVDIHHPAQYISCLHGME